MAGVVQMISSVRCIWRGKIKGVAGALHKAVALTLDGPGGGPCDYNLIDCSGIDPRCVVGGGENKLTIGGASVEVVGVDDRRTFGLRQQRGRRRDELAEMSRADFDKSVGIRDLT